MRSRQKPSSFKTSLTQYGLVAAASFAFWPAGSLLRADETLPAAQMAPQSAASRSAENQVASLPALPPRTAMQPIKATPIERLLPADLTDSVVLNSRSFGIPFNIDNAGTRPVEVRLFVSRGNDSEWKLFDRKPPTVKEFQFKGTDDGRYWFATRTIDAAGNAQPKDHLSPQLRVFIDTAKPQMSLQVDADASGRVEAAFTYEDQTPIKSIQIHYATDVLREWTKLGADNAVATGKIKFTPKENWQQLSLQIITTDAANNRAVISKLIQRPRIATEKTPDFAVIDAYDHAAGPHEIQLVANGEDNPISSSAARRKLATEGSNKSHPSMYVHRADDTNRSIFVTGGGSQPSDDAKAKLPAVDADAKIAQVPTYAPPTNRRSPQPVTNSFFRPGQPGASASATQPFDPRQTDPRSLTQPNTRTNQFGLSGAPQTRSFGPPSVTQNRKQYQLMRPTPAQPAATATAPPATFAPRLNAPPANVATKLPAANTGASRMLGTQSVDPNAPPVPRGMTAPDSMQRPSAFQLPPSMHTPAITSPTTGAPAIAMPSPQPTTPPFQPAPQFPAQQFAPRQSPPQPFSAIPQFPAAQPSAAPNPGMISLPPASTPEQISNGFGGLNKPNGPQTFAATEQTEPQQPAELSIDRQPPKQRASRTVAEAMRPLDPKTASNNPTQATAKSPSDKQPSKKQPIDVESPAYRAMRQSQADYDQALLADRTVVRYSDSERFSLEYELEAIGAGGAESVELYGSTNAGKTWKRWGNDPDLTSPFDIETKGEGTFAFKIVVISRNGLASPRPLSGETPDIAVIVDKSKPDVKITDVKYGEGERTGSLVIRYDCKDPNLMQRPIALSFSDSPDGPWTTIAGGLQNEGDYVWPGDPELPRKIYLRIDAKDRAGNDGTYLLEEPIDSQGLAPRARIRGFRSLSDRSFADPKDQTAGRPSGSFK
ncbi:hypothetical protein [Planctomycetes bacterium K23_9]|uniref:Ser-Thr-rich glycosyl-phosphatidyl-inositol-anchored membrane family protein n=1 Tax=Stieleria marina TaxID=1930275 RepID=A0A517NNX5_9BACT|nr:hypothetical protein K239x_07710 [Planctomycetes bacterium K23_9]